MEKKQNKVLKGIGGIGYGLLFILLFYAIQLAVMFVMMIGMMIQLVAGNGGDITSAMGLFQSKIQEPEFLTIMTCVSTAATTLVFGIWYKCKFANKKRKDEWQGVWKQSMNRRNVILFSLAAVTCYLLALDVITIMQILIPKAVENYEEMMNMVTGGNEAVSFLFVVFLAPIGEECFMRGFIFRKLEKVFPVAVAIGIQACLFGIFHFNIVQGVYVILLGVATGYVAYKYRSIIPCIFIHMIYNSSSFVLSLLPEKFLDMDVLWIAMPILPLLLFVLVYKFTGIKNEIPEEV
ncbi:MAG: CPBP family intramembrane metalloprotease [Lachnospiraceae bacterium]|nr:CPBP family intramembrane metalloprotease [Lachnospiraceae bacterium]